MISVAKYQGWSAPAAIMNEGVDSVIKHYTKVSSALGREVTPGHNVLITMGDDAMNSAEIDTAIESYKTAVKYYPDSHYAHSSLAGAYVRADKLDKAQVVQAMAVELARKQSDPALESYAQHLVEIIQKLSTR